MCVYLWRVKLFWRILGDFRRIRRGIFKEIDRIKVKNKSPAILNSERPSYIILISSSLVLAAFLHNFTTRRLKFKNIDT